MSVIDETSAVPKQLNINDILGTNYDFDTNKEEVAEKDLEGSTPTDYEKFKAILKGSQFTSSFAERSGIMRVAEMGDMFDVVTKEIVLVESDNLRTVALFCESDESFLGFVMEEIRTKIQPRR